MRLAISAMQRRSPRCIRLDVAIRVHERRFAALFW